MTRKEIDALNRGRQLKLSAGVLMPLLQERKEHALQILIRDFKMGESNLLTKVAELAVLQDLINEMIRNDKKVEQLERKHNGT